MTGLIGREKIKLLFVGGHHTPALAVIDRLKEMVGDGNLEIVWVGHRHSMERDQSDSWEYKEVTSGGWKFYDLKTPKFHRRLTPFFWLVLLKGILSAALILIREKPRLIMSFGGYLSVPVALSAYFLSVPVLTHEQTSQAGFANRAIARFCRSIFISFESSRKFFPKSKVEFSGNPLRRQIFEDRGLFRFPKDRKTIYITGGKQGAHRINLKIAKILPQLLMHYNVIHQCGSNSVYNDYRALVDLISKLPEPNRRAYILKEYFDAGEIGSVYARADLVIGRSGANTVYELGALKKKCLLIPLPKSSYNEQQENARLLASFGLAKVLEEENFDEARFHSEIVQLLEDDPKQQTELIKKESVEKVFPLQAASFLADRILEVVKYEAAAPRP